MNAEDRVKECIADTFEFNVREIQSHHHLVNDYRADDIELDALWTMLEDEFELRVPDDVTEKCFIVQDIIDYFNSVIK